MYCISGASTDTTTTDFCNTWPGLHYPVAHTSIVLCPKRSQTPSAWLVQQAIKWLDDLQTGIVIQWHDDLDDFSSQLSQIMDAAASNKYLCDYIGNNPGVFIHINILKKVTSQPAVRFLPYIDKSPHELCNDDENTAICTDSISSKSNPFSIKVDKQLKSITITNSAGINATATDAILQTVHALNQNARCDDDEDVLF